MKFLNAQLPIFAFGACMILAVMAALFTAYGWLPALAIAIAGMALGIALKSDQAGGARSVSPETLAQMETKIASQHAQLDKQAEAIDTLAAMMEDLFQDQSAQEPAENGSGLSDEAGIALEDMRARLAVIETTLARRENAAPEASQGASIQTAAPLSSAPALEEPQQVTDQMAVAVSEDQHALSVKAEPEETAEPGEKKRKHSALSKFTSSLRRRKTPHTQNLAPKSSISSGSEPASPAPTAPVTLANETGEGSHAPDLSAETGPLESGLGIEKQTAAQLDERIEKIGIYRGESETPSGVFFCGGSLKPQEARALIETAKPYTNTGMTCFLQLPDAVFGNVLILAEALDALTPGIVPLISQKTANALPHNLKQQAALQSGFALTDMSDWSIDFTAAAKEGARYIIVDGPAMVRKAQSQGGDPSRLKTVLSRHGINLVASGITSIAQRESVKTLQPDFIFGAPSGVQTEQ